MFEQLLTGFTENVRKNASIFGENLIEYRNDFLLKTAAYIADRQTETRQIFESKHIFIGDISFGIPAESCKIRNEKAVEIVVFNLTNGNFPESGSLDWIEHLNVKTVFDKEEIQWIPVVSRGFQTDSAIVFFDSVRFDNG